MKDFKCNKSFRIISESYSTHTSCSFSPSIADSDNGGVATPNSSVNEAPGDTKHPTETNKSGDDNGTEQHANKNNSDTRHHHHHPHTHHHHHHKNGCSKTSKSSSTVANHTGTYNCQFCDKTFPRLGYLKKHEQVNVIFMLNYKSIKVKRRNCITA